MSLHEVAPLDGPQEWSADGLCAQTDPEIFFPERGESPAEAKKVCARCPAIEQCLQYALGTGQEHGVWGGLSAFERRQLTLDEAA